MTQLHYANLYYILDNLARYNIEVDLPTLSLVKSIYIIDLAGLQLLLNSLIKLYDAIYAKHCYRVRELEIVQSQIELIVEKIFELI